MTVQLSCTTILLSMFRRRVRLTSNRFVFLYVTKLPRRALSTTDARGALSLGKTTGRTSQEVEAAKPYKWEFANQCQMLVPWLTYNGYRPSVIDKRPFGS